MTSIKNSTARQFIKESGFNCSLGAITFLVNEVNKFIRGIVEEAKEFALEDKKKTIMESHLKKIFDSVSDEKQDKEAEQINF